MRNKQVDDFIASLSSDISGAVRLNPLLEQARRGVPIKDIYAELRRMHLVIAASFKAAEMIANSTAACTHEWSGRIITDTTERYSGFFPTYTRHCNKCLYRETYEAVQKPRTEELYQPVPEWVIEYFNGDLPSWAVKK